VDPWLVLDISETKDRDAVKRAYMAQLGKHNPEDDPEGFQKVRQAYERIIEILDTEIEDPSLSLFMNYVKQLYGDFSQRVSVDAWKLLLKQDICTQLATEDEAGRSILQFLMDNWYLPGAVLKTLDDHFNWLTNKEELKAVIPAGFLDYIGNQIRFEYPRYDYFDTGKNPDRFIHLLYEAENKVNNNELEGIDAVIEEMEQTGVSHPYMLHAKARLALLRSDNEGALGPARFAFEQYPDDFNCRFVYALILQGVGNSNDALPLFRSLLEELPTHVGAEAGVIECLMCLEEYEEARERLLKLLDRHPSSAFAIGGFQQVSEILVGKYEKLHEEDPGDIETTFMLAKHYLNRARTDDCYELLTKNASPGCHTRYYEFMGECLLRKGQTEQAIEHFMKDISITPKYRNYVYLAAALYKAGRFDDAMLYADEALLLEDEDTVSKASLHSVKGQIYYDRGQYTQSLAAFDDGICVNNQAQQLFTGKATVYRDMGRFAEAMDCCMEAISLLALNPDPYTIEMDIYLRTDQPQRILDVLDVTENYGINEMPPMRFYEACALFRLSREDEALDILHALILDGELEDEEYEPRIYRELSHIMENRGDLGQAIGHMKKAIARDKKTKWPFWEIHLGRMYRSKGDLRQARDAFTRMINKGLCGTEPYIERGVLSLMKHRAGGARRDFERAVSLDVSEDGDYDRIIRIYTDFGKQREAKRWEKLKQSFKSRKKTA